MRRGDVKLVISPRKTERRASYFENKHFWQRQLGSIDVRQELKSPLGGGSSKTGEDRSDSKIHGDVICYMKKSENSTIKIIPRNFCTEPLVISQVFNKRLLFFSEPSARERCSLPQAQR
jgi:hypothetical protein